MAVDITKAPSPGPKNLRVERATENGGNSLKATWGNPADALTDTNHKWSGLDGAWTFQADGAMSGKWMEQRGREGRVTGDLVWVRDQGVHESETVWLDPRQYNPVRPRILKSVLADIYPYNSKAGWKGPNHAKATFAIEPPVEPEVTVELDEDAGEVTWEVTQPKPEGHSFCYDTRWRVERLDSAGMGRGYSTWGEVKAWQTILCDGGERSAEFTLDLGDLPQIAPGQWIQLVLRATSRGCAGNSEEVSSRYVHAYPAQAQVTSVTCSSLAPTGIVSVGVRTSHDEATAPVDRVTLQRLSSVSYSTADSAGMAGGWEDVASDDAQCKGLSDLVSEAMPATKRHTWYRLRTEHGGLTRLSEAVEATCLYHARDAHADDAVTFLSVEPSGGQLTCRLGWKADSCDATEVAWSAREDAWESTDQPDSFVVTWEDDEPADGCAGSCAVSVSGLDEGGAYYLRARRVQTEDGTHGPWCPAKAEWYPSVAAPVPTDVILSLPAYVATGEDLSATWTLSGTQAAWSLHWLDSAGARHLLAEGEGASGACVVPASVLPAFGTLRLVASVTCGGAWADSNVASTYITERPTLALVASSVTAQPMSVGLSTDCSGGVVAVTVTSRGVSGDAPGGYQAQVDGDAIWAASVTPAWAAHGAMWAATLTMPTGLDLRDGGTYDVTATVTDPATGLVSGQASVPVTVAWEHQATCPAATSAVVPDPGALSCAITPVAPGGAADGDVCDVWRVTADGACLVAADVPFGTTVTDPWAPFGSADLAYRLCTRTADGDLDWADFPYELPHDGLRVDFGGTSVSLPYNLALSDSWSKGFEGRRHMDGTVGGYWDESASRQAKLSTDVVRVEGETLALVRQLAAWGGACYVRTPDGCAFEADVQVTGLARSHGSSAAAVSLSATEVALTDEYRVPMEQRGEE